MSATKPKTSQQVKPQKPDLQEVLRAIERDERAAKNATRFEPDEDFVTNLLRSEFVAQVRSVMKQKGIKNPAALAKLTGLSAPRLSAILQEQGNITLRTIAKIAVALDVKVTLQFGDSAQPKQVRSQVSTKQQQPALAPTMKTPKSAAPSATARYAQKAARKFRD